MHVVRASPLFASRYFVLRTLLIVINCNLTFCRLLSVVYRLYKK